MSKGRKKTDPFIHSSCRNTRSSEDNMVLEYESKSQYLFNFFYYYYTVRKCGGFEKGVLLPLSLFFLDGILYGGDPASHFELGFSQKEFFCQI